MHFNLHFCSTVGARSETDYVTRSRANRNRAEKKRPFFFHDAKLKSLFTQTKVREIHTRITSHVSLV